MTTVKQGLIAANLERIPDATNEPVTLVIRDHDGVIRGGLLGRLAWGWLRIDTFWVDAQVRGKGYGTWLLHEAENMAISQGCLGAHLDSMGFQNVGFYLHHGYEVFGTLDDYPAGHIHYYLKKQLK